MTQLFSTGQLARLLDVTEPQLAEAVRRGRVDPPPPVIAGRRLWSRGHIIQVAEHLGVPVDKLLAELDQEGGDRG